MRWKRETLIDCHIWLSDLVEQNYSRMIRAAQWQVAGSWGETSDGGGERKAPFKEFGRKWKEKYKILTQGVMKPKYFDFI